MDNKTQERIKADAEAYAKAKTWTDRLQHPVQAEYYDKVSSTSYIAGATAENSRAKVLVDALEEIERRIKICKAGASYQIEMIRPVVIKALEQWKGKEVEPVKEIEYMPIHPDDARKFDCPTHFPMHLLDEGQAQRNHSQTLKRLKERGGLSVREILAIVGKKPWSYYSKLRWDEAIKMLNDIVITNPQK